MTFFVASFSMLAKLVKADGRVTEPEIQSVRQFMIEDLRLNASRVGWLRKIFSGPPWTRQNRLKILPASFTSIFMISPSFWS